MFFSVVFDLVKVRIVKDIWETLSIASNEKLNKTF